MAMRRLLCYLHGEENDWEAICVDLDIAVAATSMDDARRSLEAAIRQYVESALQEEPEQRAQLLNRRAPFVVRLKWAAHNFLYALSNRKNGEAEEQFVLPCPA